MLDQDPNDFQSLLQEASAVRVGQQLERAGRVINQFGVTVEQVRRSLEAFRRAIEPMRCRSCGSILGPHLPGCPWWEGGP